VKANHEFSVRTARVYMQCAEKETDLEALRAEVGGDCVDSIRRALWLIKPQSDRDTITNRLAKARETAKANKLKRSAAETTGHSSFDLKATLDNTAPDEVVKIWKNDEGKLEELSKLLPQVGLKETLKKTEANDLFLIVKKAWDEDRRDELARLIGKDGAEEPEETGADQPPPTPPAEQAEGFDRRF